MLNKDKVRGGQSGAVFILVILIIVVAVVAVFLTYSYNNTELEVNNKAYIHNYGASILLSFLRSSTGNTYPDCSKVSDLIFKLYSSPPEGKCCGVGDKTCKEYVYEVMNEKWKAIESRLKRGYVYYLEINKPQSNLGVIYKVGNESIKEVKGINKFIIKQEAIPSHVSYVDYPYAVLYIVDKRDLNAEEKKI